jgi:hypothetical protein
MGSKRRVRRRSCGTKKKYDTMSEALEGMRYAIASGPCERMRVYKCQFCHKYHFGRVKSRILKMVEEIRTWA